MKISNISASNNKMNNKQVAFQSSFVERTYEGSKKIAKDLFEPERFGNMGRWLFLATAFIFLLGGRIIGSRDKNEKRETLTRDVPTIAIIAGAVPILERWMSKHLQRYTGFAIMGNTKEKDSEDIYAEINSGAKNASEAEKLEKGVVSNGQLKNWYIFDENLSSGFQGFCERLSNLGGNLKKTFSCLNDDIKEKLKGLNSENKAFMKELFDGKNSDLLKTIEGLFKDKEGNNALRQAEFMKAVPKLVSIAITLGLLGIFIPLFNIGVTEKLNKQPQNQ